MVSHPFCISIPYPAPGCKDITLPKCIMLRNDITENPPSQTRNPAYLEKVNSEEVISKNRQPSNEGCRFFPNFDIAFLPLKMVKQAVKSIIPFVSFNLRFPLSRRSSNLGCYDECGAADKRSKALTRFLPE